MSYPPGREGSRALPLYETPKEWSIHTEAIEPRDPLAAAEALALFKKDPAPESRLSAVRHLMLALGDISTREAKRRIDAGYTAQNPQAITEQIASEISLTLSDQFPSGNRELNHEIARLLGMLPRNHPQAVEKVTSQLMPGTHPSDDAHYLFALAQIRGERSPQSRRRTAAAFLLLDQKLSARRLLTDRNWTANLRDAFEAHLELDPELGDQVAKHHAFGHPSQWYLLKFLPKEVQVSGARAMAERKTGWSAGAFSLVRQLLPPEDLLSLSRAQWDHPQLRPVLAGFLAEYGDAEDRKRVEEFYRPPAAGIDLAPFHQRLAGVDWASGDARRGQAAYARFTCTACHEGNTRLGPRLNGIAKRFGRDDLFRHINEPNLAVSDLYKATQITTRDGQTYVGVPVYKSEAQTILETGTGETIRFSRHDIITQRHPNQSPMPPGLLLSATEQDLADLYAYLKTL